MIDLHTHTNYSDGTWNLRKILEEAEKTNIEVLSITDHNTINCYKELEKINIKDIFKGKIIPGVEFSTVFDGVMFHLLAYDFESMTVFRIMSSSSVDYVFIMLFSNFLKSFDCKKDDEEIELENHDNRNHIVGLVGKNKMIM